MRLGLALAGLAMLAACAADRPPDPSDLIARHRWAIRHPRPIDLAVQAAAAEAGARCGGPVILNVEGDPADHGSDPADYECAPRREAP